MNNRYHRQLLVPEIGEQGQRKLEAARVLIVGVGGLGSPVATYLCGAGVGRLGLVDDDTVSLSNLHRQVLYTEAEVGRPKVQCAARRLRALNSRVCIDEHPVRLTAENADSLIGQYDLVVDGCDNPTTRYLISDTCAARRIPYIYGGVTALGGQVAVLCHGEGAATYRTLFPEASPQTEETAAVVGPTPAIVGSVQAAEALKLIAGFGEPLTDKLWNIDLLTMQTCIISLHS